MNEFSSSEVLSLGNCAIELQTECLEIPKTYGGGGTPPVFRWLLRNQDRIFVCGNLRDLGELLKRVSFPFLAFVEQYPAQIAWMIAVLEGFPRPVQDNELYGFVEKLRGVRLADVSPRFIDGELRWLDLPLDKIEPLRMRRLFLNPFRCTNEIIVETGSGNRGFGPGT